MTFGLLDGAQATADAEDLLALHAEVYGEQPDDGFARRFAVLRRQPGFVLAEARHGGYLVGYAFGAPLRPSTSWWRQLTTPLPEEVTTEHPGRTFALVELAVRPSWRRQGIAGALARPDPGEPARGASDANRPGDGHAGPASLPEVGLAQGGPHPRRRARLARIRRAHHHAPDAPLTTIEALWQAICPAYHGSRRGDRDARVTRNRGGQTLSVGPPRRERCQRETARSADRCSSTKSATLAPSCWPAMWSSRVCCPAKMRLSPASFAASWKLAKLRVTPFRVMASC